MIQYKDKLKDSRWLAKRQAILARDSFRCVICGSNNGLNVHHSAYIYGREPWEYDNKYLVTLCHECHAKLHGKYAVKQTYVDGMKIIFYKSLLQDRLGLTPTERICYSYLVSKSFLDMSDSFEFDGLVNVTSTGIMNDGEYIPMRKTPIQKMADDLKVSKRVISYALKKLSECKFIDNDMILVQGGLTTHGYFQLDLNTGLTGELLIFYSYLKDVSKTYNGEINTRKFVIEERMNTTKIAVKKLLLKLYARGLAEKIEKYKLTIL